MLLGVKKVLGNYFQGMSFWFLDCFNDQAVAESTSTDTLQGIIVNEALQINKSFRMRKTRQYEKIKNYLVR